MSQPNSVNPDKMTMRLLRWEACYNARDLGGYATGDGGQTRWGALVRADNMARLTPAGRAALLDYGVRTIIDLRRDAELVSHPSPFAVAEQAGPLVYLNMPFSLGASSEAIAAVEAMTSESLRAFCCAVLDHYGSGIARVMTAIANAPQGGVLFHCHAGKDRTGLVAALLLALAGVPYPTIVEDYALSAVCLQQHYEERLRQEPDPEKRARLAHWLTAVPETMVEILSHLDTRYDGARPYLLGAGVTPQDLERLRQRVRE
jgi:protein-tyrosine phosphatase